MTNKINDGGSAFPLAVSDDSRSGMTGGVSHGMTLRDYFAAKAMVGLLQAQHFAVALAALRGVPIPSANPTEQEMAAEAYVVADAMLKAREVPRG